MNTITVDLGARSYPIVVGNGILAQAAEHVLRTGKPSRVAVLTHPALAGRYALPVACQFDAVGIPATVFAVPSGERFKNLGTVGRLYGRILGAGLDRKSLIIVVGGGVLGDMGGFVAATYMRGIPLVQIPTTLLAQVDASIGGKTGVDLPGGKNLVGAFHQPRAVLIDVATIATLPARELRAGLAEVLKYGIICDERFFDRTVAHSKRLLHRSSDALEDAVLRSCEIKAEVVAGDETEQGRRAILNFGHTVGHALEWATGFRRYKHGEAIAIGMVAEARIGERIGVTAAGTAERISAALDGARLPTEFPADIPVDTILAAMARDKKAVSGDVRFALVRRVGEATVIGNVPASAIRDSLSVRP